MATVMQYQYSEFWKKKYTKKILGGDFAFADPILVLTALNKLSTS